MRTSGGLRRRAGAGGVTAVFSARADQDRARRGSLPQPRGPAPAARDERRVSRSWRCAATSSGCSPRSSASSPTWSSRTSACRRARPTRGSRRPSGCACRTPTSASSSSASMPPPATCSRSWKEAARGRAYLLKERVDELEQLVGAIRAVAAGGSVIDPKVVEELVAENARGESSPLSELTPRERDVLREMAEGKNNAGDRRGPVADRAVGREGDPLDLPQARAHLGDGRPQARQGRDPVPRGEPLASSRRPAARRGAA